MNVPEPKQLDETLPLVVRLQLNYGGLTVYAVAARFLGSWCVAGAEGERDWSETLEHLASQSMFGVPDSITVVPLG